ncbi:MAG: transcriptional regulator [Acidobacteria bacterium]|nr:transcriptional regulator [Acidobacteriota bacterium]
MNDLDRLIHEPARLVVVALLHSVQQADFLWLLRESGLTKGNLSSHLAKLEEGGYIKVEKTFRGKIPLTLLELTPPGRAAFESYRKSMTGLLSKGGTRR